MQELHTDSLKTDFFFIERNAIAYQELAQGTKLLIAIHGYAQIKEHWSFLKDFYTDTTIIAIDLPYHGETKWKDDAITLDDLNAFIDFLLEKYSTTRFNLIGYSLGGKVSLNIYSLRKDEIDNLILLAPDGLHHNFWFDFATRKKIGKDIFRYVIVKPKVILKAFDRLNQVRILNDGNHQYFKDQFSSKNYRFYLYKIWNSLRLLHHDIESIQQSLNNNANVKVQLIMGQYDKIINIKYGIAFKKAVPKIDFTILPKGHRILNKGVLAHLTSKL